jgi:hypothetical protein
MVVVVSVGMTDGPCNNHGVRNGCPRVCGRV